LVTILSPVQVFRHDRFVDTKFYKAGKEIKHPVMGFGTLCPGKRYALLQLKWYLMTIITRFEARLQPGQHAEYDSAYHGHEVLPPTAEVDIDYRPKSSYPVFKFRTQRPKHRSAVSEDGVSMAA
jgi:cholesterol 7alpha-monooxygenase